MVAVSSVSLLSSSLLNMTRRFARLHGPHYQPYWINPARKCDTAAFYTKYFWRYF